jgi:hypothetical protein
LAPIVIGIDIIEEHAVAGKAHQPAIEACQDCANACDHCAVACLAEPQPKVLARCIELAIDCSQTCRLAIGFLARGSDYDSAVCALAAVLCDACAEECDLHRMEHCRQCAAACRRASRECARIAEHVPLRGAVPTGTHENH